MRVPSSLLPGLAAAAVAAPAWAHDGAGAHGLLAGLAHPVGGLDHLAATLGVGLLAGLAADGSRAHGAPVGRVALAALIGLLAGAACARPGGAGWAEPAVALGLLALAAAVLAARRIGARGLAAGALAVLLPHGALHASEGAGAAFFAGLGAASAALFAAGALAGLALATRATPRGAALGRAIAAATLGAFAASAAVALR